MAVVPTVTPAAFAAALVAATATDYFIAADEFKDFVDAHAVYDIDFGVYRRATRPPRWGGATAPGSMRGSSWHSIPNFFRNRTGFLRGA